MIRMMRRVQLLLLLSLSAAALVHGGLGVPQTQLSLPRPSAPAQKSSLLPPLSPLAQEEGRALRLRGGLGIAGLERGNSSGSVTAKMTAPPLPGQAAPPTVKVEEPGQHLSEAGSVTVVLRFRTFYKTRYGENVVIVGSLPVFGDVFNPTATETIKAAEQGKGARLQYLADDEWGLDVAVELEPGSFPPPMVNYRYCIVDDNHQHLPLPEGGGKSGRALYLAGPVATFPAVMEVRDVWKSQTSLSSIMLSSAFTDVIFHDASRFKNKAPVKAKVNGKKDNGEFILRLTMENPRVEPGHTMGVIGSCPALGGWEDGKVTPMSGTNFPLWELEIAVSPQHMPVEYRYVIMEDKTRKVLAVEQGDTAHRVEVNAASLEESLTNMDIKDAGGKLSTCNAVVINDDPDPSISANPLFKTQWRGAGVALPVFGLRTAKGMGVGEFADLKLVTDWCNKAGLKMIQLLPVTDTTSHCPTDSRDSYPYSSISVYALHPMYLRLGDIPSLPGDLKTEIEQETRRFNDPNYFREKQWDADLKTDLDRPVDFDEMMKAKIRILRKVFEAIGKQTLDSEGFKQFMLEGAHWLKPYGLFCWIRDFFGTANHEEWGALGAGRVSEEKLEEMTAPTSDFYKGISFYWFTQYQLHLQLKEASEYAATHGVVLKGDLPIGVDHDSVDAWYMPHLFHMDKKTGAPPDDYAEDGQNWGFPTYNWDAMAQDGYSWWSNRLGWMSRYFQAFRIDHILGFFRIWEMPATATGGLLGRFRPSLPITIEELRQNGLESQINRLTNPYIKRHLLERNFGHDWFRIKERFLEDDGYDSFRFKAGLQSEVACKAIVEKEGSPIGYKRPEEIIHGLNQLINNVVLLRDDDRPNDSFYPRIEMWKSSSFQELPGDLQHNLRTLYQSYFYGRQDQYWADTAMKKLPALLDASRMLVCGEDLGMIPACVAGVLEKLVIMGLKIQRMPSPGESDSKFGRPDRYPYMSVCTPSCHDMSTVAGWWEEDQGRRQEFWNTLLQRPGEAPGSCTTEVLDMIVKQHLWSPSCWAVFSLQDLLGMDDRLKSKNPKGDQINWPPNPAHYWRWRSSVSMEDLMKTEDFAARLKKLIMESGRCGGKY